VIVMAGAQLKRAILAAVAATGLLASLAGPFAYSLSVVGSAETGSMVSAGPAVVSTASFGGGPGTASPRGAGSTVSSALALLLEQGSSRYSWVAATSSGSTAASLELATGRSVMAIGGFTGSDNSTTLAGFEKLVADGRIHYYIVGGGFGGANGSVRVPSGFAGGSRPTGGGPGRGGAGGPGGGVSTQIESWVSTHFRSTTVGGTTLYDLTQRTTA
jgi:hypothetical protein